jgi:energy-coupling factor transporter transmembrane protein EcfT
MWLTPRIELLPFSGKVFPLGVAREDDPVDQSMTIAFVLLNVFYLTVAAIGARRLWRHPPARIAVVLFIFFIVLRTAFLTTQEAPEPRYVLVCFPILLAFAAQMFAGKKTEAVVPAHRISP